MSILGVFIVPLRSFFQERSQRASEHFALRQQLAILHRKAKAIALTGYSARAPSQSWKT